MDLDDNQTLQACAPGAQQEPVVRPWLRIGMSVFIQELTGERHKVLVRRWFNLSMMRPPFGTLSLLILMTNA